MLDVGIGYGWHWSEMIDENVRIIGIDMSLGNLLIAKSILGEDSNVLLVCANASELPIRDGSISGVWSVQTIQHFPDSVFERFQKEMNRILSKSFIMEIYNLQPAILHRLIYRLLGKRLHRRGHTGQWELNRLSRAEWIRKWHTFRSGQASMDFRYSELFFHPDLHVIPERYPVKLEQFISISLSRVASLFARQGQICIESRISPPLTSCSKNVPA
ncbi:MAG: class I SAM-dependent methyltransferase [Deltaproteobacteria bacterium]|nr:class I SAM-dependent methyltransferase [Deltaproteobacteria bacterium]